MARRLLAHLTIAALLASCSKPATQLVVVVDTDYAVPEELAEIRARIEAPDGTEVSAASFALTGADQPQPTRFVVPLSFGVVPVDGDASRRLEVIVSGMDPEGRRLVVRSARTGFIEGRTLRLPMFLLRSCESVECGEGQTCDEGVCVPNEIDPMDLDPVDPGDELDGSIGAVDASDRMDAGADGGSGLDAGADAGPGGSDAGADGGRGAPRFVRNHAAVTACGAASTDVSPAAAVPAGHTLVVSVAWRNLLDLSASVTDSGGNTYRSIELRNRGAPLGQLFVAEIVTPLGPGDSLMVSHPAAPVTAVVVDELAGVRSVPQASRSDQNRDLAVTSTISTPVAGLVYVAQSNLINHVFSVVGVWQVGAPVQADCAVMFGRLDLRTYWMSGGPGMVTFEGTLDQRQNYLVQAVAFGP